MVSTFELNEPRFMALNGGPQYTFTPANSYVITLENHEEINYYRKNLAKAEVTADTDDCMINLVSHGKIFRPY